MIARIQLADGLYIDARSVPVALIGLFEGWQAGLLASALPVIYRLVKLGGAGALAGAAGVIVAGLLGGLAHAWARRQGRVRAHHAFALSGAVFVATFVTFAAVGPYALRLFGLVWLPMLVTYLVGIGLVARLFQDVVEQAHLAAGQQRFRAIIDEASEAIRIVDPDTFKIIDVNRRECELSGYRPQEMIGRDVRQFWPTEPELRARQEASAAEARAQGYARAFGMPYRTRSGRIVSVDSTRRIVAHRGRRYEIIVFREAAEREAVEASRREAGELRAVTLLAGAAAHEINNPLAVVMGSLDLLSRRLPDDGQEARWVEQALDGVRRIRDIVARMTRITKIESTPAGANLPPILDLERSSDDPKETS
jgi:PAS domain S-box-containing protein